jgi:hypothetical protein
MAKRTTGRTDAHPATHERNAVYFDVVNVNERQPTVGNARNDNVSPAAYYGHTVQILEREIVLHRVISREQDVLSRVQVRRSQGVVDGLTGVIAIKTSIVILAIRIHGNVEGS